MKTLRLALVYIVLLMHNVTTVAVLWLTALSCFLNKSTAGSLAISETIRKFSFDKLVHRRVYIDQFVIPVLSQTYQHLRAREKMSRKCDK